MNVLQFQLATGHWNLAILAVIQSDPSRRLYGEVYQCGLEKPRPSETKSSDRVINSLRVIRIAHEGNLLSILSKLAD